MSQLVESAGRAQTVLQRVRSRHDHPMQLILMADSAAARSRFQNAPKSAARLGQKESTLVSPDDIPLPSFASSSERTGVTRRGASTMNLCAAGPLWLLASCEGSKG